MEKVGIIKLPYWGKNLIRNFHEIGILGVFCDKDPRALAQFRDSYPNIPCVLMYPGYIPSGNKSLWWLVTRKGISQNR